VPNLHYHWEKRELPMGLMPGRAGLRVAGFVVLAVASWNVGSASSIPVVFMRVSRPLLRLPNE
jgi:hypothetical protein